MGATITPTHAELLTVLMLTPLDGEITYTDEGQDNMQRARWGLEAMATFAPLAYCNRDLADLAQDGDLDNVAGDLIANILHAARHLGFNPAKAFRNAASHYNAEIAGELTRGNDEPSEDPADVPDAPPGIFVDA